MTSTVNSGESLANKPRNKVTSEINGGTLHIKAGTKQENKEDIYIDLEGGKHVLGQPGSFLPSSNTASSSKDLPTKISQTVTLTNSVNMLIAKRNPSVHKDNVGVKKIVKMVKSPVVIDSKKEMNKTALLQAKRLRDEKRKNTEGTMGPICIKQKANNELNEQVKKFKPVSLNDYSVTNSECNFHDDFLETDLQNICQSEFNHESFLTDSEESESSSSEYIYETLEDEAGENRDRDYSQHEILGNKDLLQNNKNNLDEKYEEGILEDHTIQHSVQVVIDEACEEDIIEDPVVKTPFQSNHCKQTCISALGPSQNAVVGCSSEVRKALRNNTYSRRARVNDKFPELPVPAHINQYGDCLKTRLGRYHYGLTLNDPPSQFFQGVLKGASGQTLAVMFGDVNLLSNFQNIPSDEIGHFMIDTTFKVIPNNTEGINQVFTISMLHQNMVIPMWYAVTSCSSPELYKRILIEFQQHVLDLPFISVLLNNDPALSKAVRTVFPNIELYGSWFHYCYGIWKELSLHNLMEKCKEEDYTLLMAVKLLMVVPFLPPSVVSNSSSVTMVDGFYYVRDFAKENNLSKEFNRVLDYVAVFWFNKVKAENFTLFENHTCALNHIETLQLVLLSYMKQNGNVWVLTRSFQSIARSTYTEFTKSLNGKRLFAKKNRNKKFNVPIRINTKKLMAGSIDLKTFLERSFICLEEILDIFLHPLYPSTTFEKTNYVHTEGWAVKICSD